jgi:hypothetical protein
MPVRSISALRGIDARSTAWMSLNFPFRLATGVLTASTITALAIDTSVKRTLTLYPGINPGAGPPIPDHTAGSTDEIEEVST